MNKFWVVFVWLVACTEETEQELVFSWDNLSETHNLNGLKCYDYDKADGLFALGYSGRYEIRDEKFKLLKEVKLDFSPYSILYTRDSVYTTSGDSELFKTSNGKILINYNGGRIYLFDPVVKQQKLIFDDPGNSWAIFDFLVETEQHFVLSINTPTVCVFIDKATYEVTSFREFFKNTEVEGGLSVVKTKQGEIILSTSIRGLLVARYWVHQDGTWKKFQPANLPTNCHRIEFIDSNNYAWVRGFTPQTFRLYDFTNNRLINTKPDPLSGNFFGRQFKEHSNGDILHRSVRVELIDYPLIQISY